jgi:hypothetical protein
LTLIAALLALAILEHWFMVLPLPVEMLWKSWMSRRIELLAEPGIQQGEPETAKSPGAVEILPCRVPQEPMAHTARERLEQRFRQEFSMRGMTTGVKPTRRDAPHRPAPVSSGRGR